MYDCVLFMPVLHVSIPLCVETFLSVNFYSVSQNVKTIESHEVVALITSNTMTESLYKSVECIQKRNEAHRRDCYLRIQCWLKLEKSP